VYAYAGEVVQYYGSFICMNVRGDWFPCAEDRLTPDNPNIIEVKESPLLPSFKKELARLGRTKYKAFIGAIEDGLINKPLAIEKTECLKLAKSRL